MKKFIENIFETHVDWTYIINTDDNYKNILQVKVQKEFKTTPAYIEISHHVDTGYTMGVYICLGRALHQMRIEQAIPYLTYGSFENIQNVYQRDVFVFVFLASGSHKIKKKAEQLACDMAIKQIERI